MVATSQIAQTTLRSVLGQHSLDQLLSEREKINTLLQGIIDEQTAPWGIKVSIVEVKDVEIPQGMQRAMARQAEAERERRAKVINAEGEYQASERLKDAAIVIEDAPDRAPTSPPPNTVGTRLIAGEDDRLPGTGRPRARVPRQALTAARVRRLVLDPGSGLAITQWRLGHVDLLVTDDSTCHCGSGVSLVLVHLVLPAAGDELDTRRFIRELWIVVPAPVQTLLNRCRPLNRWRHGCRCGRGIETVREVRSRSEEPADRTGQVDDCCDGNDDRQEQRVLNRALPGLGTMSCVPHLHPDRLPCLVLFAAFQPEPYSPSQQPSKPRARSSALPVAFGWAVRTGRGGDGRAEARPLPQ